MKALWKYSQKSKRACSAENAKSVLFRLPRQKSKTLGNETQASPRGSTCGKQNTKRWIRGIASRWIDIKGLLLQSFSCCFNAACPVFFLLSASSVVKVLHRILKPWRAQRPHWKRKHYIESHTWWNEKWTCNLQLWLVIGCQWWMTKTKDWLNPSNRVSSTKLRKKLLTIFVVMQTGLVLCIHYCNISISSSVKGRWMISCLWHAQDWKCHSR